MTIREHFKRTFTRLKNVVIGIAVVLAGALTWLAPELTRLQNLGATLALGLVLTGACLLGLRRRFVCPRCEADLGRLHQQAFRSARRSRGWFKVEMRLLWDEWNECPHCHISFDAPVQAEHRRPQ